MENSETLTEKAETFPLTWNTKLVNDTDEGKWIDLAAESALETRQLIFHEDYGEGNLHDFWLRYQTANAVNLRSFITEMQMQQGVSELQYNFSEKDIQIFMPGHSKLFVAGLRHTGIKPLHNILQTITLFAKNETAEIIKCDAINNINCAPHPFSSGIKKPVVIKAFIAHVIKGRFSPEFMVNNDVHEFLPHPYVMQNNVMPIDLSHLPDEPVENLCFDLQPGTEVMLTFYPFEF